MELQEAIDYYAKRGEFGHCRLCEQPVKGFDFKLWVAVQEKEGFSSRLPKYPEICRKCAKEVGLK